MKRQIQFLMLLGMLVGLTLTFCSQDKNFNFAWISDTHIGAGSAQDDLISIVEDINSQSALDFVLLTGDVTEMGSNAEFASAKMILDSLKKPYYILPGNHDTKWSESGCTRFSELWSTDRINFEFGEIRFIGIHQGPIMRMGDGHFAPEDLRWLDSQLKDISTEQPLFFVTHYPLDESISNWYEVIDRLKGFNTQVVLCGHGHRNQVLDFEGITGVMGRSALRLNSQTSGYNIVKVNKNDVHFFEKNPGEKIKSSWFNFEISQKNFKENSGRYQRPDFSSNERFPDVKLRWCYKTYSTIACAPEVWEDYVVVGNSNGTVNCLYVENGNLIWKFEAATSVYSTPEVDSGKVVFGCSDGNIYCLEVVEGKLLWKVKTAAPVVASPVICDSVVYVGSSDSIFRALDLKTGQPLWQFDGLGGFVEAKPLLFENKVIFGAWDTYLYALNLADGTLAWKWSNDQAGKLYSPAACWPVGANHTIFIVAPDRFMTAINAQTGNTLWRTNRYRVRESIGISVDQKTIYAKCMQDTMVALFCSPVAPQVKWAVHAGFGYDIDPAMPAEKDGVLYFGTQRGFVYALEAETGNLLWKYRASAVEIHTVVPINEYQVVGTDMDGRIFMIERFNPDMQ